MAVLTLAISTLVNNLGATNEARSPKITITKAEVIESNGSPGEVLKADKESWIIACENNALNIKSIIPSGKKEMNSDEFLRGFNLEIGTIIE